MTLSGKMLGKVSESFYQHSSMIFRRDQQRLHTNADRALVLALAVYWLLATLHPSMPNRSMSDNRFYRIGQDPIFRLFDRASSLWRPSSPQHGQRQALQLVLYLAFHELLYMASLVKVSNIVSSNSHLIQNLKYSRPTWSLLAAVVEGVFVLRILQKLDIGSWSLKRRTTGLPNTCR